MRRGALSIPARWVVPRRGMQALGPKVQQRALTGSQCEPLPNDPGWAGGFLSLITQPAALACWLGDAVSVRASQLYRTLAGARISRGRLPSQN